MGIDNIKSLLFGICIVFLLLCVCMSFDYADNETIINITNNQTPVNITEDTSLVNVNKSSSMIIGKASDKVHYQYNTISMWAKPSVRSGYSYRWYKFTWINYCPNCRHYNCLLKNPKMVPEREYTCRYCDSDFCAVTGKEKYSWSHVYLRRA